MAIYTQYGRYIKAKLFKQALEAGGGAYMGFGLGNPAWDNLNPIWDPTDPTKNIAMAPYDTSIITKDDPSTNQFYDKNSYFSFIDSDSNETIILAENGVPKSGTSLEKYKDLLPMFPCLWKSSVDNPVLITFDSVQIHQNDYMDYFITGDSSEGYTLHKNNTVILSNINVPTDSTELQYFTELLLRGGSITNTRYNPVGLLGMVKCDVSFVKDIGGPENYTSDINQFWYGDRYWEIVYPSELNIDNDVDSVSHIYPHHLLITATINPTQLCSDYILDHYATPRQLGIFHKIASGNSYNEYKISDWTFDFGQVPSTVTIPESRRLRFTLPYQENNIVFPKGDFEFILHDYIKGAIRHDHQLDRFGYVIGF